VSKTSKTPDVISDDILTKLKVTAPGFSFELGTPERKIVDAVAEAISEGYVDQYLVGSLLDIESKAGLELEQWVGIFGFGRLQGRKATGVVRVELAVANIQDIPIALGTQFYTRQGLPGTANPLYFATTQAVVIPAGNYVVDIPVECTVVGVAGNVPPDSIVYLGSIIGATSVTNLTAFTGGVDVETDDELRQRFKDTFLRNIAGTADWYVGLAYQNQNISKAIAFGPITKYATQINVPDTTVSLPVTADVKYAWCLDKHHRVLTEDLRWVPVGSLHVGDRLVGFDEFPPGKNVGGNNRRTWQPAVVTKTSVIVAPRYEMSMESGKIITCTGEHMWLCAPPRRSGWRKTSEIRPGDKIRTLGNGDTWEPDESFDAGWLAGIFDAEGYLGGGYGITTGLAALGWGQNLGPVQQRIEMLLKERGFETGTRLGRGGLSQKEQLIRGQIKGGVSEILRFLGTVRTERLLASFPDKFYGGSIHTSGNTTDVVASIQQISDGDVVALGTSTRTLVTEGLLSHNSDGETIFQNLGADSETFYQPLDDYLFTSGASPQLTRVSTGAMTVGDVIDVEFQYTTQSSRNDPLNGVTNKVDIFVNGTDPVTVTERTVVSATTLSTSPTNQLYVNNFARVGSAGAPSAANRFMRLGSVPVVSFPSSIVVGVFNYQQGVHYHVLRGTTLLAGSVREVAGIEWTPAGPASGTELTLNYVYNRIPEVLGAIVNANKQMTTDTLVHQASYVYLNCYLSVEVDRGFVITQVTSAIQTQLQGYFAGLPYGAWVQFSDLCLVVHQVLGVNNVYVTTSAEDSTNYGVQVFGASDDPVPQSIQTGDFKLDDNQLPIFMTAYVLRKPNR
jgi:uncharacterized phage protein gp47/JayE